MIGQGYGSQYQYPALYWRTKEDWRCALTIEIYMALTLREFLSVA